MLRVAVKGYRGIANNPQEIVRAVCGVQHFAQSYSSGSNLFSGLAVSAIRILPDLEGKSYSQGLYSLVSR